MYSNDCFDVGSQAEGLHSIGTKLFSDFDFSDVTLVCADNQHVPAHRAVLCASSSFLRELLYDSQQQRIFLFLGRVNHEDLRTLLEFIYLGACSVQRSRLENVLRLAEDLKVSKFMDYVKIHQNSYKSSYMLQKKISSNETCGYIEKLKTAELELEGNVDNHAIFEKQELNEYTSKDQENHIFPLTDHPKNSQDILENLGHIGKLQTTNATRTNFIDLNSVLDESNNMLCSKDNAEMKSFLGKQEDIEIYSELDYTTQSIQKEYPLKKVKRKRDFLPKVETPEADKEGMYNCDKCEYRSNRTWKYTRHKVLKHEGFSYNCEECLHTFQSRSGLDNHVESIHRGVWFKCNECHYKYSLQKSLERHEVRKTKCIECDYYSCAKSVDRHMSTMHNSYFSDGYYNCDQCSYQTKKCAKLMGHIKRTHTDTLILCDHCDYKNKSKSIMKFHVEETHLGVTYPCSICDFRSTKDKVRAHKEKEHRINDFPCYDCSFVGETKKKYRYHRDTKHPKEDYYCAMCNFKFYSKSSLSRHKRHQHESQPVRCEQCSYTAKSIYFLKKHVQRWHTLLTNKQNHEKIPQEICKNCGKQIRTLKTLADHKRKCINGQYVEKTIKVLAAKQTSGNKEVTGCKSQECCVTADEINKDKHN